MYKRKNKIKSSLSFLSLSLFKMIERLRASIFAHNPDAPEGRCEAGALRDDYSLSGSDSESDSDCADENVIREEGSPAILGSSKDGASGFAAPPYGGGGWEGVNVYRFDFQRRRKVLGFWAALLLLIGIYTLSHSTTTFSIRVNHNKDVKGSPDEYGGEYGNGGETDSVDDDVDDSWYPGKEDFRKSSRSPGKWARKAKLEELVNSPNTGLTTFCKNRFDHLFDRLSFRLHQRMGKRHSFAPVLVSGIGDSGTRAIEGLLKLYQVAFGPTTATQDSMAWMGNYEVAQNCLDGIRDFHPITSKLKQTKKSSLVSFNQDDTTFVGASGVYKRLMSMSGDNPFNFGSPAIFRDDPSKMIAWWQSLEYLLSMLKYQLANIPSGHPAWGVKHPRLSTLLPLFLQVFGDDFRYVHVLRDPRETGFNSHSNIFFKDLCNFIYTDLADRKRVCRGANTIKRMEFDVKWTETVVEWLQTNLRPEQFIIVRVEDLVFGADPSKQGKTPGWDRLLRWLDHGNLSPHQADGHEKTTAEMRFENHESQYGGNKYSSPIRKSLNAAVLSSSDSVLNFFHRYGYVIPESDQDTSHWAPKIFWTCLSSLCLQPPRP